MSSLGQNELTLYLLYYMLVEQYQGQYGLHHKVITSTLINEYVYIHICHFVHFAIFVQPIIIFKFVCIHTNVYAYISGCTYCWFTCIWIYTGVHTNCMHIHKRVNTHICTDRNVYKRAYIYICKYQRNHRCNRHYCFVCWLQMCHFMEPLIIFQQNVFKMLFIELLQLCSAITCN